MSVLSFLKKASGGTFNFLKNSAIGLEHTAANAIDVVNAGRQGLQGLADIGFQSVAGTDESYQKSINKTQKAMDTSLRASRGLYTPEEAASNDFKISFLKPVARGVVTYAPFVLAPEISGAAAGLLPETAGAAAKFAVGAATDYGVNTATNVAGQAVNDQPLDFGKAAKDAVAPTVFGQVLQHGIPAVKSAIANHTPLNEIGAIGNNVNGEEAVKIPVDENSFVSITKNELENLSKTDNPATVKKIIGDALPPNIVDKVASAIASSKDKNVIQNLLAKGAKETLPTPLPRTDDLIQSVSNPRGVDLSAGESRVPGQDIVAGSPPPPPRPILDVQPSVPASNLTSAPTAQPVNPVRKVVDALKGDGSTPSIQELQDRTANLQSQARGQKAAAAQGAAEGLSGRDSLYAQLGALKGKLPKADAGALLEHLKSKVSPDEVNSVLDSIEQSPNLQIFEKIKAKNAIVDLFDEGRVPAPHEFKYLEKSLGSDFVDGITNAVTESTTKGQKIRNTIMQVLGAPKSIMASYDASGLLRQGGVLGSRFPKEFAAAAKDAIQYFKSDANLKSSLEEIGQRDTAPLMKRANLAIAGADGITEEAFASSLAEKIPGLGKGIAASDRGYTGFLTKLRADSFDHIMNDLKESGIDPNTLTDKQLQSVGKFINTASGRGSLGSLEKYSTTLSDALFSPRLWKSRLDMLNPAYYAKLDPIARKYALQSAGSFAAIAATVLGLATLAGANVETDPRSSDFLKIKVGNTRYDILGGFQQNIVAAWREISGEKKNSMNGSVSKLGTEFGGADRLTVLSDLFQNKENPVISTTQELIRGKDRAGQPVNPLTEVGKLGIPLTFQDIYSATKDTGNVAEGAAKSVPGLVGVSTQTYGTKDLPISDKQKKAIEKLRLSGASKEELDANKNFYQTAKTAPKKSEASDKINEALAKNDLAGAKKIADDYNKAYAAAFKKWASKYDKYSNADLVKAYASGKIKLTSSNVQSRLKTIKENQ